MPDCTGRTLGGVWQDQYHMPPVPAKSGHRHTERVPNLTFPDVISERGQKGVYFRLKESTDRTSFAVLDPSCLAL